MEILENLGVYAIFAGLITWLIKSIGNNLINKNFKAMEHDLEQKMETKKYEFQKSLQDFKYQLEIISQRSSKIYDQRLERITEIYKLLSDLQDKMEVMTAPIKFVTLNKEEDENEEKQRIKNATESFNKFAIYYYQNKIFFPKETSKLLDQITADFRNSHWDYMSSRRWKGEKIAFDKMKKASEIVRKNIPKTLNDLEDQFRNLIGETP